MDTSTRRKADKVSRPAWMRGLDITLRTAHIGVAGILFGGFVFQTPFPQLLIWHDLTIVTGCGLLVLELLHSLNWPHQGRGLMGMLHIAIPGIIHLQPSLVVPYLWATLIIGCVGSHMPRRYRNWSILYREVVD